MKYILSIDQGTTGSRAVLYDIKGRKVKAAYEEFKQYFPKPGWVEHDPEEIWRSVDNSIQKVLKGLGSYRISAIGITNQRETTVIWDKITGKPVYNAIVWQCRRTASRCQQLKRKNGLAGLIRKRTGLPIDAYFSSTKIEWVLKNVPGALDKAKKGKLLFGTTDTWILWKLTGGKVHATDYTNASRTMLFNIDTKKWDDKILKVFNIPRPILPDVKKSSGVFGKTIKIGNLQEGVPISGIAGDQQAALFGQGCFEKGDMKNTYGTGSFILLNTGSKRVASDYGLIATLGCGKNGEPVYALEGSIFVAGSAIQWLRDGLKMIKKASDSEDLALSLKSNEGVYFVPALVGLGAPYWDPFARGGIFGITRGTTVAHFARAALEAMCYQTRDVIEAMKKDSKLSIKNLKVDGGAVSNNFLCQFQSDILRIKITRPKIIETTSLGAAYLAGLGVKFWKSTAHIKKFRQVDKIFYPKMSNLLSKEYYSGWKNAVKKVLTEKNH